MIERSRRLRNARDLRSHHPGPGREVTLAWLWLQFRKIAGAGQSWFVVSLVSEPLDLL